MCNSTQTGNRIGRLVIVRKGRNVAALLDKILRAGEGRALKQLFKVAESVNSHESTFASMSGAQLREMTEKNLRSDFPMAKL